MLRAEVEQIAIALPKEMPNWMISPLNPWRRNWDMLIGILVLWIAWIVPYINGFFVNEPYEVHLFNSLLAFFFGIEIILNFFTAYVDNGKLVRHFVSMIVEWHCGQERVPDYGLATRMQQEFIQRYLIMI
jgi:hypothetical protein